MTDVHGIAVEPRVWKKGRGAREGTHSNCPKFQQLKCRAYTRPMPAWMDTLLNLLALPQYSLGTVFVVSFISATLLPLGSEPVVFGLVELSPAMFWPVVLVATAGNTLGGAVSWWMGLGAELAYEKATHHPAKSRALNWLKR